MIRYLITDGTASPANIRSRVNDVDFIQIREQQLTARELAEFTRQLCPTPRRARILVNDRADVAIACGANGVHLRDGSVAPNEIRKILPQPFVISVARHTIEGVKQAAAEGADYIVLAPVFNPISKESSTPPLGLDRLREAAASVSIPVIALGGITQENAGDCVQAGAAGVAGISLFR